MNFPVYNPYQFFSPNVQQAQPRQDNNTLIPVHSQQEVFNYPVAPGNSVSFKHENEPYIYIKTMGLSQFDQPIVTKFKLLKEDIDTSEIEPSNPIPNPVRSLNEDDLKPILDDISQVKQEIEDIKKRLDDKQSSTPKKESVKNDK